MSNALQSTMVIRSHKELIRADCCCTLEVSWRSCHPDEHYHSKPQCNSRIQCQKKTKQELCSDVHYLSTEMKI
jgi:hypothetical protein